MASHMKTTVEIPDTLLAKAQEIAARKKTTLRALVQEGLIRVVEQDRKKEKPYEMPDCSVGKKGQPWGLEGKSWGDIQAIIYEGRGE
jgi:hypothetical protein